MRRAAPLVAAATAATTALWAAYSYYYTDNLTSIDPTKWTQNGSVTPGAGGLTAPTTNGGSLISLVAVPDGTSDYEVKSTLTLPVSGGTWVHYLRASTDALSGPAPTGSFYAVELQNPTFTGSTCSATLAIYSRVNGVLTLHTSTATPCRSGMTMRSVVLGNSRILAYVDDVYYAGVTLTSLATGKPGIGARATPSGSSLAQVQLGPLDRVAPSAVNSQSVGSSLFPNLVDLQWQGAAEDANGIGIWRYEVRRNNVLLGNTQTAAFSDATAAASTSYTYSIRARDYHYNLSAQTSITVTTPPAGAIDPRRIGVRPTGNYWGAMGEQIDLLSGNLNFSVPLLRAQGRGGWGATFALSYNSQLWRKDPGGTWKLGRDVGYGFGWRLLAGSLTPYWSDYWTLHHWVFTNSTGAELRLDVNTGGVWTSKEAVYLSYDSNTGRLYFNDGSFWVMGAVSAGTEQDAGTRYPTLMQDSNGNQVLVRYHAGLGAGWTDSSARIDEIEDVRALACCSPLRYRTYTFSYNTDAVPHLTGVANTIGTAEGYTLTYTPVTTLQSPFSPPVSYGATHVLATLTMNGINLTQQFFYGGNNSAELTKAIFPYGGELRWDYRDFTFTGTRTLREVQYRHLVKSAGAALATYTLQRDEAGDAARTLHRYAQVVDPSGPSKVWWFTVTSGWSTGLLESVEDRTAANTTGKRTEGYTWVQDAVGNPYISAVLTTVDPGTAFVQQSKREQAVDTRGNVTQSKVYDYGNLTTPARTYNNTYLSTSNYTSRYIYNRLALSTVTPAGGSATTLVTNSYDSSGLTDRTGLREHDSANYGQSFWYRGNLTVSTRQAVTTTSAYDITGMATSVGDGTSTVAVSPASGTNNAATGTLTPNGDPADNTTEQWNAALNLTQATGPNGATTTIGYDAWARPAETTSPHGAVTTFTYTNSPPTKKATTTGRWVKTTSDGLGRTVKVESGNATTTVSVAETEYDSCACSPLGKVKRVSQPYAPGGTVYWTTYTYDGIGRTVSVAHAGNSGTTSYVYEGNTVKTTDAAGKWKKFTLDAMGNLTKATEPNPAGGADVDSNYSYNVHSQLTQVTMTRGATTQTRTFVFDSNGRMTSSTNPENGTVSYTYHPDGQMATKTAANGNWVEYDWNAFKRPVQVRRFSSSGLEDTCNRLDYSYNTNPLDMQFSENAQGRLTVVQWGGITCAAGQFAEMYSYTVAGAVTKKRLRLTRQSAPPNPPGSPPPTSTADLDATYTHDTEGKVVSVQYPSTYTDGTIPPGTFQPVTGKTYINVYDSMQRLQRMYEQISGVDWVSNVQYGAGGEMTQMTYGGSTETRQYNVRGQLTRLTWAGSPGVDLEYRYSATQNNGRITQMKDWATGEEVNYTYDSLNRLITAVTTGPEWGLSFTYDGFGNKTQQTVTKGTGPQHSLTINPANNRITTAGFSYDSNGNLTATPTMSLGYDVENRLVRVDEDVDLYAYAPDNKRLWKKTGTAEEVYFYGVGGMKLGTYKPAWEQPPLQPKILRMVELRTNLYFGSKLIASGGGTLVTDRLGSVVISSGGQRLQYYPYGEEKPSATGQNMEKFGTYYRDATTGFDYADQRYYGSQWGRFMTPDPYRASGGAANPGSWNRYVYVEGDPVNHLDPSGLWLQSVIDFLTGLFSGEGGGGSGSYGPWGGGISYGLVMDGGGAGAGDSQSEGVQVALDGLSKITEGGFKSKAKCRDFFEALRKGKGLDIDVDALMNKVAQTASDARSGGYVYDGPSSPTVLDPRKFPGAASPGVSTVGNWFAQNPGREALSQADGLAIWIRASNWEGSWSAMGSGTSATGYGLGILMHELLHKDMVGGFTHSDIDNALGAVGMDPTNYALGRERRSDQIGRLCF